MGKIRRFILRAGFMIAMLLATTAIVYADELSAQIHYTSESIGGAQIDLQVVDRENYLFLPGIADLSAFSLTPETSEQTVLLKYPGSDAASEVLDLRDAPWDGNTCTVQVEIAGTQGNPQNSAFIVNIMKGSRIGSIFYCSDDRKHEGRSWIDKAKENRGSGSAIVTDRKGTVKYDGKITDIHARGNSSFNDPKKSYQIKLDKKGALIEGTKKAKKWILLAQYKDPLRMSDKILKDLAGQATRDSGRFSPKEEFVDLYYDGEYRGLYLLSEKVEIGEARIDINDMEKGYEASEALEGRSYGETVNVQSATNRYGNRYYYQDELSDCESRGGYLMEMNSEKGDEYNWFNYVCGNKRKAINIKSPELGSMADVQYISEYFQEFCIAVGAKEADAHTGKNPQTEKYYYEYCDAVSLADTYLIQTIASNLDGFKRSLYFYKDADQIMCAGPVWDMDLSFGTGWRSQINPQSDYIATSAIAQDLIQIPHFREKVKERYLDKYQPSLTELLQDAEDTSSIWGYSETIRNSVAMDWMLWPNKYKTGTGNMTWDKRTTYDEIVQYRADWLRQHKEFLDEYLGNMDPENPGTVGGNTGGGDAGAGGGGIAPAYKPTEADKAAAAAVTGAIEKLPAVIALDNATGVTVARTMYDALTSEQKDLVSPAVLASLQNAEKAIAAAIKNAVNGFAAGVTLENEAEVTSAFAAYSILTAKQKAMIEDETVQKLEKASETIADWKEYLGAVAAAQSQITAATAKSTKGKKLVVKWQKVEGCSGYQIRYSIKKNFKSGVKQKTVKDVSVTKLTIKGLKKGRTYFVQVRPYTNVTNKATGESGSFSGQWSKAVKAKIKK